MEERGQLIGGQDGRNRRKDEKTAGKRRIEEEKKGIRREGEGEEDEKKK